MIMLPSRYSFSQNISGSFTYQDLKRLIQEKDIRTIEQLTAALPDELQKNVVFRVRPRNKLQEGPRAIRFTTDGALTITHNDDASKKGGLKIEVLEKDSENNHMLHEISFSKDGGAPPTFMESSPHGKGSQMQSCTGCHGNPPRKIWPSYPKWKDACGRYDDVIEKECEDLLTKLKTNKRFKDLKWDAANSAWPYRKRGDTINIDTMPNSRFTLLMQIDNAEQFAKIVAQSPLYEKLKYTLFSSEFCFTPEGEYARLKAILSRSPDVKVPANWSQSKGDYVFEVLNHKPELDEGANFFGQSQSRLFEFFGIQNGNLGGGDTLERNGGTGMGTNLSFNRSSSEYLLVQLLKHEAKTDLKIKDGVDKAQVNYFNGAKSSSTGNSEVATFYKTSDVKFLNKVKSALLDRHPSKMHLCEYFKEKSAAELAKLEKELEPVGLKCAGSQKTLLPVPQSSCISLPAQLNAIDDIQPHLEKLVLEKGKSLLESAKCIACHNPKGETSVGPRFSFDDPAKFAQENLEYAAQNGSEITQAAHLAMKDPNRTKRMPLNNLPLNEEDQKAITAYLNFISKSQKSQP